MTPVEYRIETIPLNREEPRLLLLVERLAELGRQGWHVASVDLAPHPAFEEGPVTVLLERELEAGPGAVTYPRTSRLESLSTTGGQADTRTPNG
jgi:hypothetical protein